MKKILLLPILLLCIHPLVAQNKKLRFAFTPAVNKVIEGIGIGLAMNASSKQVDYSIINGVSIEILGIGLALPLAGSDPLHNKPDEYYKNKDSLAAIIKTFDESVFKINGVSVSAGGLGGHDIIVNGVNLSCINTFTRKTNGFSICVLLNMNMVMNGVSIGAFNATVKSHGVQIGLLNGTDHLKGFQIGLWNVNQKRKLPFINWCFN